uniref:Aminotransferase class I/classII large domain-containing protein n=2 Tax=Rhizophora mucronata TaxID=61149 RepID=A0A2P2LXM9_RHIMU
MDKKLSSVAKTFTPSTIQELSHLAQSCQDTINLAEGFPDFPAPSHIKDAAVSAINSDFNQYRHVQGLCDHLARIMKEMHGLDVDPATDVAVCCGQTEAFAAAVFAVIDPGDEIVLFDPSYETYEGCIRMAGGIPVSLSVVNWRAIICCLILNPGLALLFVNIHVKGFKSTAKMLAEKMVLTGIRGT